MAAQPASAGEFLVESRHCSGTAVEAARSSEGIFTSILLLSLFYVGECPVDAQFLRKRVGSIMKLDQKSKVKKGYGSTSSSL